jgi:hypothetical protein
MEIKLNPTADSTFNLFYLTYDRAAEILDAMAMVLAHAANHFEEEYQRFGVVVEGDLNAQLMHGLDIPKILREMLNIGATDNERNYILYTAYTGIERIQSLVHRHY